ncbi:MAG: hypothetical protein ACPKPY_06205 [Nitrososphaeraceae archaeon]
MVIKINVPQKESKGFKITQERIDVVNKATEYMKILSDFGTWSENNFHDTNVEKAYNIFEEFVKSNKNVIKKIKKLNFENNIYNNNNKD